MTDADALPVPLTHLPDLDASQAPTGLHFLTACGAQRPTHQLATNPICGDCLDAFAGRLEAERRRPKPCPPLPRDPERRWIPMASDRPKRTTWADAIKNRVAAGQVVESSPAEARYRHTMPLHYPAWMPPRKRAHDLQELPRD